MSEQPERPEKPVPSVKSAERALRLVELLAEREPRSFTELYRALGMPKSSLHALLASLAHTGWVADDGRGGVSLGYRARAMGLSGLDESDVLDLVDDVMEDLRARLDETIHLARLDDGAVLYLASKYSRQALGVRFRPGRRMPSYATALGKAMLAALPASELALALPREYAALTPHTLTSEAALAAELDRVRAAGYAEDHEEGTVGLRCLAVALQHADLPLVALSCSVPVPRMTDAKRAEILAALLDARSTVLGRLRP
ncbi:IclR family transcriptional regulator [Jiangella rhizosphaerae]|uniref:IclR family transcriptional regulator n=1 Tax=Jiangella rhizosphaerae TaxID=2293569 RepID=A0A418KHL4_9ACTN|nr:IclR family transcriptional regulator [Jiangella rhizosphaerae]RIQ11595.1 IclR family transcriptional regulator [Jiangella rhizosphaerae]